MKINNNDNISCLPETKFLGLIIDTNLRWFGHIDYVCAKLAKTRYGLCMTTSLCSEEVVKQLYYGGFHSAMKYAILHWEYSSDAHRVFILQKRAIRIIRGLRPRNSCKHSFRALRAGL